MPGIDLPSWRKPASIIIIGGILAFVLWTLPSWGEFWRNVSQFPSFWQIPANRRIIIFLIIKIISPVLIMGIIGIVLWLYSLMKTSRRETSIERIHAQQGLRAETGGYRSAARPVVGKRSQTRDGSFSTQAYVPSRAMPRGYNPETPLPPTLLLQGTQGRQVREFSSSTVRAEDEQSVSLVDRGRENNAVAGDLTAGASFQLANIVQPMVSASEQQVAPHPLISLRLLKDISVTINIPGGGHVVVPLTLNAKRVQLLAYIAWRRGELIDRDKILEHVFGWGLSDEEATEDKLSERFESHKKLLRKRIRDVVAEQVNKPAGRSIIDPDLDPFLSNSGFWGLSDICRVEDLEAVDASYKVIAVARRDGKLVDEIPDYVKESCEGLIASYPGDFLESLIKKYPSEFRSWQGHSSWTRKPYTQYRDYYLDALWYAAEYEWRMGQRYGDGGNAKREEEQLRKQQEHFGRAAQKYQNYAMYVCNSKFDAKATFGAHGEVGERIGMSERALRRCVVLLGAIGRTDLVNQVWSAYTTQMKSISDQRWQPSKETQADVQAARAQTSAYRFAAQVSQMSSEFADGPDRVS